MSAHFRTAYPFLVAFAVGAISLAGGMQAWASAAATTTTLAITSGGSAVTSVAPGTVVTLTANVTTATGPVTTGRVKLCDAAAAYCTDVHLLGTAQLTAAGTAEMRLIPGIGSHSYKAVFPGTAANAASVSAESSLTVSPPAPISTTTFIAATGAGDTFALTATVSESGSAVPPTGSVSFLDTTNASAVLGSATLGQSTALASWTSAASPAVGSGPYGLALADFNGDGIADLAAINRNDGTVTILLGNGDGTFSQAGGSPVTVGNEPVALMAADFNGDGNTDLAITNSGDGTVTILLGNGDGTFVQAANSPITVGKQPRSMTTEDFNGDGITDLAVANFGDGTVTILLGKGDGTFTPAAGGPVATGATPYSVAAADFNGDGLPDLAVANGGSDTVTILLGKGDGTFSAAAGVTTPAFGPTFVIAADFNGDGKADLAVVNNGNSAVIIQLGNGDGTFAQSADSPVSVGFSPYSVVVGDFNLDGIPDLAVANACGNGPTCKASSYKGTVTILLGNGDGTFTPASKSQLPVGNWPISIVAGDFSGDGTPDLAVTNYSSATVSVLLTQLTETAVATASGIAPAGAGTHMVEATYSGDSNYTASTSATTSLDVQPVTPAITVTPGAASITAAQALTVTITVSGGNGAPAPTGSVTLTSGSYTSSATALSGGSATVNIPAGSLTTGSDTLTAKYAGDSNYNPATGTAAVTVTAVPNPSFTLDGSSVTVAPGATTENTSTITITPAGGFTGSVALTASMTSSPASAQDPPTLSFGSTSPVSVTGTDAVTATLTIATTASSTAVAANSIRPSRGLYAEGGAALASILIFGVARRRRRFRAMLGMLALLVALTGGVLSCGNGAKKDPGTTPGSYTITVTGTSGALTANGTVTLTVK